MLLWAALLLMPVLHAQNNTNSARLTAEVPTTNSVRSAAAAMRAHEQDVVMSFGLDQVTVLQSALFGIPRWKYLSCLIFVVLAFAASKFLDFVVGVRLRSIVERHPTRLGQLSVSLLHGPVKIVTFVILLHIGLQALSFPDWIDHWLKRGLQVIVAISITYMTLKFVDVLIDYWRQRPRVREDRVFNEHLFPIISKTLKIFILVVAVLVTCQNLGLDITAPLASLSIGGLALGLAAQDTVANLFGAVAVFVDKPFRVGDFIKLEGISGVVESIGLRSTRVRNLDGHLITVPNKTMGNATITNVTRRPNIKTEMNIGITYETPIEKVKRALAILDEVYRGHPMTGDLVIGFNKFADSALNINVVHWWKSTDYRAYVKGMQDLNLTIKQRFDAEGIEFAFPTQTLYIKYDGQAAAAEHVPVTVPENGVKRI